MDLHGWVAVLRLPIEIFAVGLAVMPSLLLLRAWSSLPEQMPVHFGSNGRPDRWGSGAQIWLIPFIALFIYGSFSHFGGAWKLILDSQAEMPRSVEPLLLLRLPIDLLMTYITWGTIRVARKQAQGLNTLVQVGLVLLIFATALPYTLH